MAMLMVCWARVMMAVFYVSEGLNEGMRSVELCERAAFLESSCRMLGARSLYCRQGIASRGQVEPNEGKASRGYGEPY